jgi:hypothetical protein
MKKLNITLGTILLVLGCFWLSPAVKAVEGAPPIVGLWDVHYTSDIAGPLFETYDQWHSDGLEFEVNSIAPGAMCQGTWKVTSGRAFQLVHVGFTFGAPAPCNGSATARFVETQIITVSLDRDSYDGTYVNDYYDADGNFVCEDTGTVHATRISVNQSSTNASE